MSDDDPAAILTASMAPMGGTSTQYIQTVTGTMDIDLSSPTLPGLIRLTLNANNTGVNFNGAPTGGSSPGIRLFAFSVEQTAGGNTWVAPTNVMFSNSSPGPTATGTSRRDFYLILWTGKYYVEVARSLNCL